MATQVVGSKMPPFASEQLKPSAAGYGQNGFSGASSDTPSMSTRSGFLPQADLAGARAERKNIQQRKVSATCPPLSFGMDKRSPRGK
jgi:hypothetical protein